MPFSSNLARTSRHQALLLAGAMLFLTDASRAEAAPVKLGTFVDDSGTDASARKAFSNGVTLAVAAQTSPTVSVEALPASQGLTPESATLKRLVEADHAPLVMYWSVDDVNAVAPYLNESNTIGLVGFEVRKNIPRLGSYIFGFGYSTERTFSAYAKFAGKKLKAYRFALISSTEPRFDAQSKAFSEETKSLGNTVVFDEKAGSDPNAFGALVTRAGKEKCDSIFAALPAAALPSFLKAVRASKFKGNVLIGDSLGPEDLAGIAQDAEGIYMVQVWSDDAAFKSAYASKFGGTPDNVTLGFAATGYDAVKCITAAPGPFDSRTIKDSFLSSPCEGLTGRTGFTGERIAQRTKRILTIRAGQFVLAE